MKKLVLSLIAVAVGTLSSFAQSDLVATLSHGSSLSTFSGIDALAQAYEAAVEGDVITLSPGVFNAVDIEKAITVRGAGMQPMESNGYVSTQIAGAMTINVLSNTSSMLSMEGVQVLGRVTFYGSNMSPAKLSKCRFEQPVNAHDISMSAIACIFANALTADFYRGDVYPGLYKNTTIMCLNCVIINASSSGFEGTNEVVAKIIATNCFVSTVGVTYGEANVPYSVFSNCIIAPKDRDGYSSNNLPETCSAHNCIGIDATYTPNIFQNIINPSNVMVDGSGEAAYSSVFKTLKSSQSNPAFTETFELTETAAATYLGDDGTQVGIYGGTNPFNPTPTNPQVKKFTVTSTSEGDQLKVKINVE